jgi:hypothetical protein
MVPVVRGAIVVAAVAGGFVGGYLLKNPPLRSTSAGPAPVPAAEVRAKPRSAVTVVMTDTVMPRPATTRTVERPRSADVALAPPPIQPPLYPAPQSGEADVVDPTDPAFQMIKNELGIKTTIRDRKEPLPAVLVAAQKDDLPAIAPPPVPMVGPTPKLETPRINIDMPRIPDHVPPNSICLLNSRDVELDFEVTKVGLSKIKAVELWTSRDGHFWQRTDRQEGARSPFRTRLGSEGDYGFRLVFESETGQRTPDPKQGERAELSMILDTTPPRITIGLPRPVRNEPGKVRLEWNVVDAHLDRAFLRIEYSEDGNHWMPVDSAANLRPDAGSFDWAIPPGLPPRVLFRFTARDKAGNVSIVPTMDKVAIDLVVPEGRLTGVRARGSEPQRGPMPRVVETAGVPGFWGSFLTPGVRLEF